MIWAQLLAYVTGTVDQELRLRNEYLATENRILQAQIKGHQRAQSNDQGSDRDDFFDHTGRTYWPQYSSAIRICTG
jgi:hypothetical protein